MIKTFLAIIVVATLSLLAFAQTKIVIDESSRASLAIPDFRGAGAAGPVTGVFNATVFAELQNSGLFRMVAKTVMPLQIPQQPSDFHPPATTAEAGRGTWLSDWSNPPAAANYLAFGYTAVKDNGLVLFGWLYDVRRTDPSGAQMLGKPYFGTLDELGARKVAREFAADIIKLSGGKSLVGSKIYYASDRTGHKEIWSMDYDGTNQKQFTAYGSISTFPAVSPDGTKIAFTSYVRGNPDIFVHSLETGRKLPFYNQRASMNAASDFTTDSRHLLFYSTAGGSFSQVYMADADGGNLRRISQSRSIDVEPKVNPKNNAEIVFVSDRSGLPQIYMMNGDGVNVSRLTSGDGEAVNPCWNPDGQHIAFAWTKGFEPGHYNIFVMDVASRYITQLTSGDARNENPAWGPDGAHLAYSSKRGRSTEIWTMLADGTGARQLTTAGNNEKPVWSKATN